MIDLTVTVDTKAATQFLNDVQRKQIPFATALALTRTAKDVESQLKRDLMSGLESPSPYTVRATFSTSAKKTTLEAVVGIKDKKPAGGTAPSVLLKEHFSGGVRGNKPMEKALISMGVLPSGWRVVPGAGMPVDTYGNPRRAAVRELIGSLRSKASVYKGRGKNVGAVGYFAITPGHDSHLEPGVYWRKGRAIRPMLMFINAAGYRKRFDLPRIARQVVDVKFNTHFASALNSALATAR